MLIVSPEGEAVCNATRTERPVNVADRLYFKKALAVEETVIEEAIVSRSTGKWGLPFASAIRDDTGAVKSVFIVVLDLGWLKNELAKTRYAPGARLGLIDSKGTVLARYPDPDGWTGRNASHTQFFRTLVANGGRSTAETRGFDDIPRIYGFARFAETNAGPIYLWVGLSKESVTAKVDREFAWTLSIAAAVLVLSFAAIWIGGERWLLRPVSAMADAARRLGQGDHGARTGLRYTQDEFGQLARSFDEMAAALMSESELLRLNRALRVLSSCNQTLIHAASENQLLTDICRTLVETGGYRMAWIGFAEHDDEKTVRPVARCGYEDGYLETAHITWADTERGQGPTGTAIRTGTVQINQSFPTNPAMTPWRAEALKLGYRSSIALPLKDGSRTFGALQIYAAESDAFDEGEVRLLRELADDTAFGIVMLRTRAEKLRAEEQVRQLAYFDPLTGLSNRVQLLDRLDRAVADARSGSLPLAVLTLNVNRFKDVQDGLGVLRADELLQHIAGRFRSVAGDRVLARLQSDVFAILLPGGTAASAMELARGIDRAVSTPFELAGISLDVSVSIGIAVFPEHGEDPLALLLRSEIAGRQANAAAAGCAVYSGATDQESPRRLELVGELRRAIDTGQLKLLYQPKVDLRTGRVSGVEALVRWQHPARGMVSPGEFIALAEHTGLIRPLTYWVINAALSQCRAWREGGQELPIAVNISANNLRDHDFVEKLIGLRTVLGINPELLQLELTESTIMTDHTRSLEMLTRLQDNGFRIFVDDFGTGYSSLSYIATLPIQGLKIDRSFIVNMVERNEHRSVVATAITLAHSLGLTVVAEGVETAAQMNELMRLECDEIQGFLFARPLPPDELRGWRAHFSLQQFRLEPASSLQV
jgi:diguanylate cyclase (GGDEF)-like protein